MRIAAALLLALAILPFAAFAEEDDVAEAEASEAEEGRNTHPVLFYVPNRIFDVMDLVRARVRLGPGVSISARVTRPVSVSAGLHASLFVGLPGPRGRARIPLPVGIENHAGADVSVFGFSTEGFGPGYGKGEIGAGVHPGVFGVDVGVDPLEALDLVLGFVFIDIADDDF